MANTTVTLIRYCKTDKGWKRYPVAMGKNGRIRPDYVVVDGKQVPYPIGHYELRFYDGRKLCYANVGKSAATAVIELKQKKNLLAAQTAADYAGVKIEEDVTPRKRLRQEADRYIKDRTNQGREEAAVQATQVLDEFIASCRRTFIDEITKDDVIDFQIGLRERGNEERTVFNKHVRLRAFMRFAGLDTKAIMPDRPRYEKKLPTVYDAPKLMELYAALSDEDKSDRYLRLVLDLGAMCGMREQEIVFFEWPDIHWHKSIIRIQGKPDWGFKIKDSEQRDIPVTPALLARLKAWREEHPQTRLVLGTKNDTPNGKLLRTLKRAVNRLGLNCGTCEGCLKKDKECRQWTLHKLRRTYATALLRGVSGVKGFDLSTVQAFGGWADIATVARYLRPVEVDEAQSTVASIFSSLYEQPKTGKGTDTDEESTGHASSGK